MANNQVKAITLINVDSATLPVLPVDYPVVPVFLTNALFFLKIANLSNQDIFISFGETWPLVDNEYIPAGTTFSLNAQSNSQPSAYVSLFAARTPIFIRGVVGIGNIRISGYYV